MKEEKSLTENGSPPAESPSGQHLHDARLFQQTRQALTTRLQWFAGEFGRLAKTAGQGVQAERFRVAVNEMAEVNPLRATDLEPLQGWLKRQSDSFGLLATTPAQIELAASFRMFAAEATSPAVRAVFQKHYVNELVKEIEDWMGGKSNGVPFASLSLEDKRGMLEMAVDWTHYINCGLEFGDGATSEDIRRIVDNAIAGKPSGQWVVGADPAAESHVRVAGGGPQAGISGTLHTMLESKASDKDKKQPRPKERERTP